MFLTSLFSTLAQAGGDILSNPAISALLVLLTSSAVVVVTTAYLRKFGLTLGLAPERLVLLVSFVVSLIVNATGNLPHWVVGGDPQAYLTAWIAWVKVVQAGAQALYEAFMARLPDLIVPTPAPDPTPALAKTASAKSK